MENREWNGPEHWKIWKSGMEQSRTMKKWELIMEGYRTIKWDTGMERSRTPENVKMENGTVPNNERNGIPCFLRILPRWPL